MLSNSEFKLIMAKNSAPLLGSSRMCLALVSFLGFINLYAQRINLSVAIVCMVNQTAVENLELTSVTTQTINDTNLTSTTPMPIEDKCAQSEWSNQFNNSQEKEERASERGDIVWSRPIQGIVLGSFFYGYLATQIIGGWLAGRFGGKWILGGGMLMVAVAALLIPAAARTHYVLVIILRIIQGLGEGVVFPACHVIWSKWAPPQERGKLVGFSYAGAQVGNIITLPLAALLCDYGFDNGWGSIFYIYGIFGVIWFILWCVFAADSPAVHPRISSIELDFLTKELGSDSTDDKSRKDMKTPWRDMFKSGPVWALIVMNAASDWGAYTLLTNIPTYMKDILRFDIKTNGFFSAIPYIAFWICINVFGIICDLLIEGKVLTVKNARKLMSSLGMIPPAIFLVLTGYLDCTQPAYAIVLLTMAQAFNGAQFGGGFYCNHIDIAPDFAGIIMGLSNSAGAITGVLAPLLIGVVVKQGTESEWRLVFYICAIIILGGTAFYLTFGDGVVQDWAKPKTKGASDENGEEELAMRLLNGNNGKLEEETNGTTAKHIET